MKDALLFSVSPSAIKKKEKKEEQQLSRQPSIPCFHPRTKYSQVFLVIRQGARVRI